MQPTTAAIMQLILKRVSISAKLGEDIVKLLATNLAVDRVEVRLELIQ
jgi:hypothetical protein